jgi:choline dehydrogenase-like flavoprotein
MNAESVGKISVVVHDNQHSTTKTKKNGSTPLRRSQLEPIIDLNYLSHPRDMEKFQNAWIASDSAFDTRSMWEMLPGKFVRSWFSNPPRLHSRRFEIFARTMVLPYFHWMGTCAMQTTRSENDDSYVVDSEFCVRSVQNLRICDASIFPTLISAPPALTCAALGVILAGKIIQKDVSPNKHTVL